MVTPAPDQVLVNRADLATAARVLDFLIGPDWAGPDVPELHQALAPLAALNAALSGDVPGPPWQLLGPVLARLDGYQPPPHRVAAHDQLHNHMRTAFASMGVDLSVPANAYAVLATLTFVESIAENDHAAGATTCDEWAATDATVRILSLVAARWAPPREPTP